MESLGSTSSSGISALVSRVLDYLLQLELTEARWERVDGYLANAQDAAAAADLGGLRTAIDELRAIGPVRVIRIGGAPVGPPPQRVRERVDDLTRVMRDLRITAGGNEDGGGADR